MRLLILGGSWFLGRTVATEALARGWEVTAFSRGRSGSPPAGVDHVRGDRTLSADLTKLADRGPWDATLDTSAFEPVDVARLVRALGSRVGRYVLVSTVSAKRDWPSQAVDETSALWPSRADLTEQSADVADLPGPFRYGTLKAGCELATPPGSLILRPGVILGPGEYVGRGLTLLERAARGGRWLLPAPAEQPIQPVDVRDVSAFVLRGVESGLDGPFNLAAPPGFATYGDLITICGELTGNKVTPVWADPSWLIDEGVRQWTEIPLWRTQPGTWSVDAGRAAAVGFTCRPLRRTVTDFKLGLDRYPLVDHPRQSDHGMSAEREAALLAAWEERKSSAR